MHDDDNPVLTTPEDLDVVPEVEGPTEEEQAQDRDRDAPTGDSPGESRLHPAYRTPLFAIARVAVVVAIAAVVYQVVVPSTDVVRARLSRLAITEPGLQGFNPRAIQASEVSASQTGLKTLEAAAKQAPNQTGAYSIEWAKSQTPGAAIFTDLLPDDKQAAALLAEIRTGQLAASSFASAGLTRRATYTVKGIPGSSGALYTPSAKSGSTTALAISALQYGRVVAMTEAATSTGTQTNAETLASAEYAHLQRTEPGFTLGVVRRPVMPTALWAAGTVVLASLIGFGPIARRRWAERRRRRLEEEQSHLVVVGGHTITKHRR